MKAKERVAALLLTLVREELPADRVREMALRARAIDARDFEANAELSAWAYREAFYLLDGTEPDEDPDPEAADDGEAAPVQALDAAKFAASRQLAPIGGDVLAETMAEWLDLFDDRISGDPHFAAAVNEAAEAGRPTTEETAKLVADRVRELAAASERGGG